MNEISFFIILLMAASSGPFYFIENAKDRGIQFQQVNGSKIKEYIVEAKGAGVSAVDVDCDGWDDIYLINGASVDGQPMNPQPRNHIFHNKGEGTFEDWTERTGLGDTGFGTGGFFADVDNDGDLDCYVTNYGPNQLYLNDGHCRFTKMENAGGAQDKGWTTGAAFADINHDGFLDLYVGNYAYFSPELAERYGKMGPFHGFPAFIGPSSFEPAKDHLFLNNGDGTFRDVSEERGIDSFEAGRSFSPFFTDLDNDGDLDIYMSDDTTYNHLYENVGNGFFEDISLLAGAALSEDGTSQGGMGVAIADVDGDMDLDIAVCNYDGEYNILYRNEGMMQFVDAAYPSGIGHGTVRKVSFGMLLQDFDNDSWPDMQVVCGHVYPVADQVPRLDGYAQKNLYFHNKGKGVFEDVSEDVGPAAELKGVSRGSACADFDRDGDLDIIVNNLDGEPFFLENQSTAGNWLQVAVRNEKGMPAYGARVVVTSGERKQVAELYSSASFISQNSAVLHFGLGDMRVVDHVEVRWPGGEKKVMEKVEANQLVVIR